MALPIEGFSVVAQLDRIQHLLEKDAIEIPNATALSDKHIWKCSFMAHADAQKFVRALDQLGLNTSQGPDSDVVIATEFDRSVEPYCEWLRTGVWDKAVIAWKEGTHPETVTAREGWDPKVGSGLEFHDPSSMQFLEFVRLEDNVEVFLNKKTGQEVYIGRTSTPVDALFTTASEAIRKHYVTAGQPSLSGDAATEVSEAAQKLEQVLSEVPDWWNALWFYGKSQLALGNYEAAYKAFTRAYENEKSVEAILRELAGVCLELKKFEEAVTVAEAAVALDPANAELLGNLAVAFILDGRNGHARKAIDAANKINSDDRINQTISRVLSEIEDGRRDRPESLHDLSKPAKPKKKGLFGFLRK
jgi:tetratricopeptide (TPR) repeat protein